MAYNKESGYGRGLVDTFAPIAPTGRQFFVGAATLDNLYIIQQTFKHDPDGIIRIFNTLAAAVAGVFQDLVLSVTASASADTLTTTSPHGISNGDKVQLQGTAAPSGLTLGAIYYAVSVTATTLKVSLQRGGTAIDLTTAGTAVTIVPVGSVGDTVYVLPEHNENISSATALNINTSGLTIIGLGEDEARPTFYLDTATTTTITISAPCVLIRNCIFDFTGFDAIVTGFTVTACDVRIDSCKFITANSTNQVAIGITTNALCDRFKFTNNRVVGTTDAGTTNFLQMVGGNDIEIVGNYIYGAYTTSLGPINNATTAGLRWRIENNTLINATASSTKAIVLVSTTTGAVRNNALGILSGTAPITGAGVYWLVNYYAASVGSVGVLN